MTVNILLLALVPIVKIPRGSTKYPWISIFLSTHGTRPHVMVTLVGEGEETCTFVGGEEGAAGSKHGMQHSSARAHDLPTSCKGGGGVYNCLTVPCSIPGQDGDGEVTVLL